MAQIWGIGLPITDLRSINGQALTPSDWSVDFSLLGEFAKSQATNDYDLLTIDLGVANTDVAIASNVHYLRIISASTGATYSIKLFSPAKPALDQTILPVGAEIINFVPTTIFLTNAAQAGLTLKILVFKRTI